MNIRKKNYKLPTTTCEIRNPLKIPDTKIEMNTLCKGQFVVDTLILSSLHLTSERWRRTKEDKEEI